MTVKRLMITITRQNHIRDNWRVDLDGDGFRGFIQDLAEEFSGFGAVIESSHNEAVTVNVDSYADMLNAIRITSPSDGFMNKCIGHILGQSQNLNLFEDIRRAVNRVVFAPETIPPDDQNRKVCHNCGCGC